MYDEQSIKETVLYMFKHIKVCRKLNVTNTSSTSMIFNIIIAFHVLLSHTFVVNRSIRQFIVYNHLKPILFSF